MELSGPAALAQHSVLATSMVKKTADVPKIEPSQNTGDAGLQTGPRAGGSGASPSVAEFVEMRNAAARGEKPAGPPPSFEVSILDVQSDLKQAIARMETARSQARDAEAVSEKAAEAKRTAEASEAEARVAVAEASAAEQAASSDSPARTEARSETGADGQPDGRGAERDTASQEATAAPSSARTPDQETAT